MEEFKLNASVEIIEAELEHFHHNNGGIMLLPRMTKIGTQSDFVKYELYDEPSIASLTLRPMQQGSCKLTIYSNDSERYGWILGYPGRSNLDSSTILGTHTSKPCQDFCNKFVQHLDTMGYFVSTDDDKFIGGRPQYEENIWAHEEYKLDHPVNEIYLEWLNRRKKAGRSELVNPMDSFKKVIYSKTTD